MIRTPTVLVLGAGASQPYGFPLGVDLRNALFRAIDTEPVKRALEELGHTSQDLASFADELKYSGYRSVDAFLERHPEFMEIGKRCSAATLLPFETERTLFPPSAPLDSWYELLASRTGAGSEEWVENRLAIITFNYDRSLEHYFSRVIAQRRRVSLEEAHSILNTIRIIHVHGTLGGYPAIDADGLEYGAPLSAEAVQRAATRIQVVSEVDDTLPTFADAARLLESARRVYFLGFGFHPDNVRRLRFFEQPHDESQVYVAGTMTGIGDNEWERIRTDILHGNWHGRTFRAGVGDFLGHYSDLT